MDSAEFVATEHKCERLQTIVSSASVKYLVFTTVSSDNWNLHISNGIDVWRLELDQTSLDSHRELADVAGYEAYFSKIRQAFKGGNLSLTNQGHKVSLEVGSGSSALNYELFEASANQRKKDIRNVLFWLADTTRELQERVQVVEEELRSAKKQKVDGAMTLPDFETTRRRPGGTSKIVKPQGRSIINPTSKKRKAARGVEFD
ncbi:protein PAXX-like [Apostichopus japonicus]|uniref:protein PAXX-like n=1 Tax=Stichopus japonicus TaxID=307972 RepID=UPI003AB82A88